ncbi:MAG: deoxyribose-phosphate aldolase [candidate division KSB1 bacterium]|nr:deoxyribose-phosphate aldolase [candidate division KSB1 bacterium]MDZ7319315.1 deoxyribose-phosphate aldolase [candidate division KSB1 bacterium]MDZ7342864.1 deoxyribose-phosphate aldolase [candidate division KSB1 bacterium]
MADSIESVEKNLAAAIDHTLLKPEATPDHIRRLCQEAISFHFATVCVQPCFVQLAAELTRGSDVKVCSVVGFPLGANMTEVKVAEARQAIADGAAEIDMVIRIGALKSGDAATVLRDIQAVVDVCHQQQAICKVIIETALLTDEEKIRACELVRQAGADFVKTSTGFGPGGATVPDVALLKRLMSGSNVQVKAAGGIRTLETALQMIRAGATRIGTSSGVAIIQAANQK